jgi:hypothetical protein
MLRPLADNNPGAAVEIHGGSGYWSCDSTILVLTSPRPPTGIAIRWPGGNESVVKIPAGATDVRIDTNGVTILKPR